MPGKDPDLAGQAPDKARAVLILVDVIHPFDFDGAERLLKHARPAFKRIAALKQRAVEAGLPVVYANDNFGRWQDDFRKVVRRATAPDARGRALVEPLKPETDDYFVLKPKLSGFFATPLELLLDHLGAEAVILAGVAADFCVLATALDAHMRGLRVGMPEDCTAAETPTRLSDALAQVRRACDADTRPWETLDFDALRTGTSDAGSGA